MKIKILTMTVCFTAAMFAQERRLLMPGADPNATKDWPKVTAKADMTDAERREALAAYFDHLAARDLFSGTVLLARAGKPIFFQSYGMANRETSAANTNDTKYNFASVGKVFTKAALMQLRDEGKVDFSKTLRTYLPDYPSEIADRVTIRQLMDHSSGMGDFFGPEYVAMDKSRLRSLSDYLSLFVSKPLEFEPGTRKRYSNAGFVVLGLVVEKVSGMRYGDYVQSRIFAPLGMTETGSLPPDATASKRAIGYAKRENGRESNLASLPAVSSSAGGGYSTATDLMRFVMSADKVMSAAAFKELFGDPPSVAFGGGGEGVNVSVGRNNDYAIIVLSNYDPPGASEIARNVTKVLGTDAGL